MESSANLSKELLSRSTERLEEVLEYLVLVPLSADVLEVFLGVESLFQIIDRYDTALVFVHFAKHLQHQSPTVHGHVRLKGNRQGVATTECPKAHFLPANAI